MKKLGAALIGAGGFGRAHVMQLLALASRDQLELVAYSEVNPEVNPEGCQQMRDSGAVPYTDYRMMIDNHTNIDLLVIATPIALHVEMASYALARNIHILIEKPPAATVNELDALLALQSKTKSECQVSFQHTSGRAFLELIQHIQNGVIGDIQQIVGIGMWHRTESYYARTPWAGKLVHEGNYILDGTINNPLAHLLNNCLVIAKAAGAEPTEILAELYHANEIESEDTSCLRISTDQALIIHYYATLCHHVDETPSIQVIGSKGQIDWDFNNILHVKTAEGEVRVDYGDEDFIRNMYTNLIEVIRGQDEQLLCSLRQCRSFVQCVNGAFDSSNLTHAVTGTSRVVEGDQAYISIPSIAETIREAADSRKLFSEINVAWGVPGRSIALQDYKHFSIQ